MSCRYPTLCRCSKFSRRKVVVARITLTLTAKEYLRTNNTSGAVCNQRLLLRSLFDSRFGIKLIRSVMVFARLTARWRLLCLANPLRRRANSHDIASQKLALRAVQANCSLVRAFMCWTNLGRTSACQASRQAPCAAISRWTHNECTLPRLTGSPTVSPWVGR